MAYPGGGGGGGSDDGEESDDGEDADEEEEDLDAGESEESDGESEMVVLDPDHVSSYLLQLHALIESFLFLNRILFWIEKLL